MKHIMTKNGRYTLSIIALLVLVLALTAFKFKPWSPITYHEPCLFLNPISVEKALDCQ